MNHVSHVLSFAQKTCQNPNPGDALLRAISLAARHPSQVRHNFEHADHRVLQFSGFASSMFLFFVGWSPQS